MLSLVLLQFQNIQSFLELWSHTENENDSIHSVTEQNKKGASIYHPYQWITLMQGACKSKPCIIYPMLGIYPRNFDVCYPAQKNSIFQLILKVNLNIFIYIYIYKIKLSFIRQKVIVKQSLQLGILRCCSVSSPSESPTPIFFPSRNIKVLFSPSVT